MFQIRLHVTVNNEAIIIGEAQNEHVPGIDERMRIAPRPQLATGQGTLIFRVKDIVYILDNILPAAAAGGGGGGGGEGGHAAAASSPYPFPMKGEMSKVWLYLAPDNEETWQYMNRLTLFQDQQRATSGTVGGGEEEERREENPHP